MPNPRIPQLGDPIVVNGDKYRIRNIVSQYGYRLSLTPKRNPTHYVSFHQGPSWDSVASVWRLSPGYTLSAITRYD